MCDIAEFDFGENKKPPTEPFQNKRIRNPATARTVPSRMVCAPSFLSLRRRGMRLAASGGRSASPHPESRLHFTLCGFLRSFLSRTSVGGLAFGFTIFLGGRGKRGGRSLLKKLRKTFMRGLDMDIVCASPIASQYGFVRSLRRSFASGWTEPSAFYGERVRDIVSYITVASRIILGMERHLQAFSHPSSAILTIHSRSAVIPTIDHSKTPRSRRHEQPLPQ